MRSLVFSISCLFGRPSEDALRRAATGLAREEGLIDDDAELPEGSTVVMQENPRDPTLPTVVVWMPVPEDVRLFGALLDGVELE